MTRYKRMLLGATAATALIAMAPAAYAFEEVDWTWDTTISENVTIDIDVDSDLDPSGAIQVEKLQMHFGDLNAVSNVSGVHNTPASGGGTIDQVFDANLNYIDGSPANVNDAAESATNAISGAPASQITPQGGGGLSLTLVNQGGTTGFGNVDELAESATFQLQLSGTLLPEDAIDAVDLPKVANSATAVANNQSIESDVPLYLHDAQFAAGGFNPTCGDGESNAGCPDALGFLVGAYGVTELDGELADINEHTSIAGLMTVAAATGFIEPANIRADANVSDILNAYVENSATAVTNNASFTVSTDNQENHLVVADLTQWGYANVSANASVNSVTIDGYTGFGAAGLGGGGDDITPIVSSSATAVGNNLSIKVGVPDVDG